MIPRDYIDEWREYAPWVEDFQVEQDLVISRAIVELFADPLLGQLLAFRGGTALYKLYLTPPVRYSEDIDLVQVEPSRAGPLMERLRSVLEPWLGIARWKQSQDRVTLVFRYQSEDAPVIRQRLKVEINTREQFALLGFKKRPFSVNSRWFSGSSSITTFDLDELLATKLRALYQRSKGRDLLDLAFGLDDERSNSQRIAETFRQYMHREDHPVTRAMFEQNIDAKLKDRQFIADTSALVRPAIEWHLPEATEKVMSNLISRLPGKPWRNTSN